MTNNVIEVNKELFKKKIRKGLKEKGFTYQEISAAVNSWEYAHASEKFSHGFDRYTWLLEMVNQGKVLPDSPLKISHNKNTTKIIGSKSLGYLAAVKAVYSTIKNAKKFGIGITTITDCYPTGCMGQYTEIIAINNLIGIAVSHSPKIVTAYGVVDKIFGTTGHSLGFPAKEIPYIYDSSIGAVSNGEVMYLHKTKGCLPQNTVFTDDGIIAKNTSDVITQAGIFQGIINIAGDRFAHRISGFAGALELLARVGVLGYYDKTKLQAYSIFIAIDPKLFGDIDEYKGLVDELEREIVSARKWKNADKVYFAGQRSYMKRKINMQKNAVSISKETYKLLFKE